MGKIIQAGFVPAAGRELTGLRTDFPVNGVKIESREERAAFLGALASALRTEVGEAAGAQRARGNLVRCFLAAVYASIEAEGGALLAKQAIASPQVVLSSHADLLSSSLLTSALGMVRLLRSDGVLVESEAGQSKPMLSGPERLRMLHWVGEATPQPPLTQLVETFSQWRASVRSAEARSNDFFTRVTLPPATTSETRTFLNLLKGLGQLLVERGVPRDELRRFILNPGTLSASLTGVLNRAGRNHEFLALCKLAVAPELRLYRQALARVLEGCRATTP